MRAPDDIARDELLAIRCQLGDAAAFDELVARWHPPLWRYVRRMTGTETAADDAVQDVWVAVLRGLPRLREGTRLRPWLFGIAHNVVMTRLRMKYADVTVSGVDVLQIADESGDERRRLADDLAALGAELDRLPAGDREVLDLFYLQDLSLIETSQVLRVPVGTVKSRLFHARQALRDRLQPQES